MPEVTIRKVLNSEQLYKMKQATPRQYVCFAIRQYNAHENYSGDVICRSIEELIEGSAAFSYKEMLVAVLSTYIGYTDLSPAIRQLEELLALNGMKAGCSDIYDDIKRSGGYFKQACVALDIGLTFNTEMTIYSYMDFAKYMILENFACGLPLE